MTLPAILATFAAWIVALAAVLALFHFSDDDDE